MAIVDIKGTLPTPYITLADAEILLASVDPWIQNDDEIQNEALGWARSYLDDNYSHSFVLTDPPDNVKYANALLANYHLTESLFVRQAANVNPVSESEVKAGSVSSKKKFRNARSFIDPFPDVTNLIADVSTLTASSIDHPAVRA